MPMAIDYMKLALCYFREKEKNLLSNLMHFQGDLSIQFEKHDVRYELKQGDYDILIRQKPFETTGSCINRRS